MNCVSSFYRFLLHITCVLFIPAAANELKAKDTIPLAHIAKDGPEIAVKVAVVHLRGI